MKFSTKLMHCGSEPDAETGAVMPPIYMSSTYAQEAPGVTKGYDYTRAGNPNFTRLEALLAALEEAEHATVFSAGLGALTAMISMLEPGDTVLAIDGLYGGSYRLFTKVFAKYGIQFKSVPRDQIEALLEEKPKWLFFETPTNPLLEVFDIRDLSAKAKAKGVLTIVDNTFATPYFQQPLTMGADIVWHSMTKYLGGHSDVVGGVVMTNDGAVKEKLDFARMAIGLNPSPFDVWLAMRGVKTLAVRMERHQENARKIVEHLQKSAKVFYPGFSGIVSAEFDLPLEEVKERLPKLRYFQLAESLGGVESLVCHPATMTHASIPREERLRYGLNDGLVRFSVGLEDAEDLINCLKIFSFCSLG